MATPKRPLRTAFIAAFVLLQLLLPLRYYLQGGGDDERFSWRMFSTTRLNTCRTQVTEQWRDGAAWRSVPVSPERDVQIAWSSMLRRNRPAVVTRYLERRCQHSGADRAEYRRDCVRADGEELPVQVVALGCATLSPKSTEAP